MKHHHHIGALACVLLLSAAPLMPAAAQTELASTSHDAVTRRASESAKGWQRLRALKAGTWLVINTDSDIDLRARFLSAQEESIDVAIRHLGMRTIARAAVRDIRLGRPPHVARFVALGLALGTTVGHVAGTAAACDPLRCGGEAGLAVAGGVVQGATLGALAGFAVAQARRAKAGTLIYLAHPARNSRGPMPSIDPRFSSKEIP